ncbi:multicopper oxidase domain-containing protein [Vibrio alginolyticus]|nr:multicopper oxidase domain-containing protein [Vibrio alginolyticus]
MVTRRSFLIGSAFAGGTLLGVPALWQFANTDAPNDLYIPDIIDSKINDQVSITAQAGTTEFFSEKSSQTFGYNGSYLGPTIRVHKGDNVKISVTNKLKEPTTVHWHGLLTPGDRDGGPHQVIHPGNTWEPILPIRQQAATLWYHSHLHGYTAKQVYAGLAGLLIVADENEQSLNLPSEYGVDDIPLILQDREFQDGMLVFPDGMMSIMHGRRGNTIVVNGTINPVAKIPNRLVRLRLVNGANAREFDLSFSDNRSFHWIASEGGLLESPILLRSLKISPGERAEILVDFSDNYPVTLQTSSDNNVSMMMRMMSGNSSLNIIQESIIKFEPQDTEDNHVFAIPKTLLPYKHFDLAKVKRRRYFTLNMGMGSFGINGRPFNASRIDEKVDLGATEIWVVKSEMMPHPFHIHGVHFEVLSRNGDSPGIKDRGLKDTVLVDGTIELLIHFSQPSLAAPFMYHCHILEHEDNGMMGQFEVV